MERFLPISVALYSLHLVSLCLGALCIYLCSVVGHRNTTVFLLPGMLQKNMLIVLGYVASTSICRKTLFWSSEMVFFCLRNSPSVNSSAVGKDLLKHPFPKMNKICVSKWNCGSEIMKHAQKSLIPQLRSWLKCRIIQTFVEWQSYLGLWGGVGLSS